MPNIKCNNLSEKQVLELSKATLNDLSNVIGCPSDWLNFIVQSEMIIIDNEVSKDMCYINIEWFKRSEEIASKVVEIIDTYLRSVDYNDIVVYFSELDKNNFYENNSKAE